MTGYMVHDIACYNCKEEGNIHMRHNNCYIYSPERKMLLVPGPSFE